MTTTKTGNAAQGVAPTKTDNKSIEKSTAVVTQSGKLEAKEQSPKAAAPTLTVQDRIAKTEQLQSLVAKHNQYKETNQKIENFAIGSDEHSQSLQLKDSKGNLFTTAHPAILKPVLALIREQVKMQVGVIEKEILDFVI